MKYYALKSIDNYFIGIQNENIDYVYVFMDIKETEEFAQKKNILYDSVVEIIDMKLFIEMIKSKNVKIMFFINDTIRIYE